MKKTGGYAAAGNFMKKINNRITDFVFFLIFNIELIRLNAYRGGFFF